MDKLRGKFITMAGLSMALYEDERAKADEWLKSKVGKSYIDLDPDGWFDLEIFIKFLEAYATASPTGERAYITTGKQVFFTAKNAGLLPPSLSKPVDFLKFEFNLYLMSLEGPNIHPRKLLQATDGDVRIEVRNPPYLAFDRLMEGVFLGAVEMAGVKNAKVEQTKCTHKGDAVCEYRITW
jgi:hypothetical protein